MARDVTNEEEAEIVALHALAWLLGDTERRERFQALTGLDAATLRARAGSRDLLTATLAHLAAYEPDLIACADAIDITPAMMAQSLALLEDRCARS